MATEIKFYTDQVYNQYQKHIIDGVEYVLHLFWNDRGDGSWNISFYDSDLFNFENLDNSSALIVGGRKLMPMQDVLQGLEYYDNLPTGLLLVADTFEELDYELLNTSNFGVNKKYQLFYYNTTEIQEFLQEVS